jgi:osmotically-inducible protein OsmY
MKYLLIALTFFSLSLSLASEDPETIVQLIRDRIEQDQYMSERAQLINIEVQDELIILEGEVDSQNELFDIENYAKLEAMDKFIENNLTVRDYVPAERFRWWRQ